MSKSRLSFPEVNNYLTLLVEAIVTSNFDCYYYYYYYYYY